MKKVNVRNQTIVLIAAVFTSMQITPFVFAEAVLNPQPEATVAVQSLEQAISASNAQQQTPEIPRDSFSEDSPIAACLPPIHSAYADQLRAQLGSDYSVEVSYAHATPDQPVVPGDLLRVVVTRLSKDLRPGELRSVNIILDNTGKKFMFVSSIQFDGIDQIDGNVLYDALSHLNQSSGRKTGNTAVLLTQIRIFNIDSKDEGIHFEFKDTLYRAYRGAKGEIVVQKLKIPATIRDQAGTLQEQLGGDYRVRIVPEFENNVLTGYRVEATYIIKMLTPGHVRSISMAFGLEGNQRFTRVAFDGMENVDWKLLYAAVGNWGDLSRLVITQINTQPDGSQTIYFTLGKVKYMAYRTENDKVILVPLAPESVQKFADKLQNELGADYSVSIVPRYELVIQGEKGSEVTTRVLAGFSVEVLYLPKDLRPGSLRAMTILFNRGGGITTANAEFDGFKKVDGSLLFEALGENLSAVQSMARMNISRIENGTIYFTLDKTSFAAYRNADGKVILKKLRIAKPMEVKK